MSIEDKVAAVEMLFANLDNEIAEFKSATSLDCFHGCGLCCQKPDIDATVLEFLPLAYHLYQEGRADEFYDYVESVEATKICAVYKKIATQEDRGLCTNYKNRGMICRLFGYGATTNKYGQKQLATCKRIKEESKEIYEAAVNKIDAGLPIPVMSHYNSQLQAIDFDLANRRMPINQAIKEALTIVIRFGTYNALSSAD
jgi:Fe-S-cluster containining protein